MPMKKETKAFLKKGLKVVVGIVVLAAMTMSVLTGCAQTINKENDDPSTPVVNPDNPSNPGSIVTPDNPDKPTDPIVNPDDPTNPDDPGKDDPTNPDNPDNPDNPNNPDNPGTPDNPDNPSNPDNPEVNPDDPTNPDNPDNPDNPGIDDPQQEELDFSALETKLEEVILAKHRNSQLNEIISYSVKDGKMILVYDYSNKTGTVSNVVGYELNTSVDDLDTQEKINTVVESISKDSYSNPSLFSFGKTSSDITVDGETYSKDGIVGDNIFAEKCGVENALMTYVSSMGARVYGNYDSGYCRAFDLLIIDRDNNVQSVHATVDEATTTGNHWDNFFIEGKHTTETKGEFNLGENLKASPEVEAMNAAFLGDEFDEYVQGNLNYIYH